MSPILKDLARCIIKLKKAEKRQDMAMTNLWTREKEKLEKEIAKRMGKDDKI